MRRRIKLGANYQPVMGGWAGRSRTINLLLRSHPPAPSARLVTTPPRQGPTASRSLCPYFSLYCGAACATLWNFIAASVTLGQRRELARHVLPLCISWVARIDHLHEAGRTASRQFGAFPKHFVQLSASSWQSIVTHDAAICATGAEPCVRGCGRRASVWVSRQPHGRRCLPR
jgi:hypothetical protein